VHINAPLPAPPLPSPPTVFSFLTQFYTKLGTAVCVRACCCCSVRRSQVSSVLKAFRVWSCLPACLPALHIGNLNRLWVALKPLLKAAIFCFCYWLPKTEGRYEIWGSHSCLSTGSSPVARDFVSSGGYFTTFWMGSESSSTSRKI